MDRHATRMPLARPVSEFVVETLAGEVLVYDQSTHRAHCLSLSAALVWRLCDGRTSQQEARCVLAEAGHRDDLSALIAQLVTAGLVRTQNERRAVNRSRRAMLKQGAVAAGIIVASPVIFSIVAPSVAEAASKCGKKTQPCCQPGNICSLPNRCIGGVCQ